MIDDFKPMPERPAARLDSDRSFQPQVMPRTDILRPSESASSTFETPEQVAAREAGGSTIVRPDNTFMVHDAPVDADEPTSDTSFPAGIPAPETATKASTMTLFGRWQVSRKKFMIIAAALAVVIVGGGGTAAALLLARDGDKPATKVATVAQTVAPIPKPIVSPLTGVNVTAEQQKLPVIGVMIENSPDARPQSGLKDAGVVFEAIAEGGITRFLALYQDSQPGNIGPIRSSRPYYLDWAMAFDASYAHVGGSPDALQRIKDIGVRDLDQFYNPSAYHRITSRYAPHNVYTAETQLVDLAKSKGYDTSTFTSLARKSEQPYKAGTSTPATTPKINEPVGSNAGTTATTDSRKPASSIDFAISSSFYSAHYDYDAANNNYKRSEGGAPHMDADSNTQLTPKVVVALAMPYSLMADGYHSQYNTTGSGKMFVFQDGTVQTGTWSKGDPKSQFVFKDDSGKALLLNAGQTWISIVGDPSNVSYK